MQKGINIVCSYCMRTFFAVLLICISLSGWSQKLRIGLYFVSKVKTVEVNQDNGSYLMTADSQVVDTLTGKFSFIAYAKGEQIRARLDGNDLGTYHTVKFTPLEDSTGFKIRSLTHKSKYRYYWGGVEVSMGEGKLKIINTVDIEDYLPGVVESESGINERAEYYKIQATISRTYARAQAGKHALEGFDLCDHTHCQVYRKRSRKNPEIPKAVKDTEGLVLVDSDINLISALFFSNCGGQTCNSENVWNTEMSYLRSVKDPFCKNMPHYYWKKEVPKTKWINYMRNKTPDYFKLNGSFDENFDVEFDQGKRRVYYSNPGFTVPLTAIRSDFKLRSTFFTITENGDNIVFRGRGFGHGVGLCQEGAMKMADLGYSYLEILKFYYTGIHLIHLDDMEFFKMD